MPTPQYAFKLRAKCVMFYLFHTRGSGEVRRLDSWYNLVCCSPPQRQQASMHHLFHHSFFSTSGISGMDLQWHRRAVMHWQYTIVPEMSLKGALKDIKNSCKNFEQQAGFLFSFFFFPFFFLKRIFLVFLFKLLYFIYIRRDPLVLLCLL